MLLGMHAFSSLKGFRTHNCIGKKKTVEQVQRDLTGKYPSMEMGSVAMCATGSFSSLGLLEPCG
jgi:hypothetical protein